MASESDENKTLDENEENARAEVPAELVAPSAGDDGSSEDDASSAPVEMGVDRYVHTAFFVAAIIASFLASRILGLLWDTATGFPEVVRALPVLIEYNEEQRGTICLVIGAVVGVLLVLRYYRRPSVKGWAFEVARELGRVTWPTRDIVTSGTIVVIIASVIATIYVTLLDRFWGYLTNLVYGA